jgi:integrase
MTRIRLRYVNGFLQRGRVYYYFNRRGSKRVRLPGVPGSAEFMQAYAAALESAPSAVSEIGASRTHPGTIDALVVAYYRSHEWQSALASDTRRARRRFIECFRNQHGDKRVALLRREHVVRMLAEQPTPSVKRAWLRAIRGLLRFAVPTMLAEDPTQGIAPIKLPKSKGHHTWTDDEIAQYRAHWPLGTQQRLVLELALQTASRLGEVVRLGPQHIKNGWITIARTHGSEDVSIPVSDELQAACDAMPNAHLTYIVSATGKPRSKFDVGADFAKWAAAAGLPKHCRLHGLKKAGMRRLAEAGGTAHELMALSGHRTLSEVQRYTSAADHKRLAATGAAKLATRGPDREPEVTNALPQSYKQAKKPA